MVLLPGLKKELKITNSGVYIIELFNYKAFSINHKKFYNLIFSPGYYYYFGSAQRNLQQRLHRHNKKQKTIRWHIDYLTTNNNFSVRKSFIYHEREKKFECIYFQKIIDCKKKVFPVTGFGNSDCKICSSHLIYSKKKLRIPIILGKL